MARVATAAELPAVINCLTSAFLEDPFWGPWSFPDPATRPEKLARLIGFWVNAASRHPWIHVSDQIGSAAVWIPPGVTELTPQEERDFDQLLADLYGPRAGELGALFERFEEHHPHDPHYYLSLWGTHRDHTGRGLGGTLIAADLARIDAERMPAYLESTNAGNLPRYEALGFEPRAEFGPPGGPVLTTMWRQAASK
jgi:hypothetical protein